MKLGIDRHLDVVIRQVSPVDHSLDRPSGAGCSQLSVQKDQPVEVLGGLDVLPDDGNAGVVETQNTVRHVTAWHGETIDEVNRDDDPTAVVIPLDPGLQGLYLTVHIGERAIVPQPADNGSDAESAAVNREDHGMIQP